MLTSLRARLWLSYFLIACLATAIVAAALLVYVLRNPTADRRESQRLRVVASSIAVRSPVLSADLETAPPKRLDDSARRADKALNARIAVFDAAGALLVDTRATEGGALPSLAELRRPDHPRLPSFRAKGGQVWLYAVANLENGGALVAAAPRQRLALLNLLADEFVPPVARALLVALLVSLLMGFWMARWIARPLAGLAGAAQAVAGGAMGYITPAGPRELREVAAAFNDMAARVDAGRRAQRDLTANVSHDLKTPLTSVQGFAQAILDGAAGDPEAVRQSAKVIYDEAGRMHRMVNDLLNLARLDEGTLPLERAPVNLAALLEQITQQLMPQAQAAQVALSYSLADDQPLPVLGDYDHLAQVFTNLVDNAIKFTPLGGKVTVTGEALDGAAWVQIADTGPGIAPADLERIFERFYQADRARQGGGQRGAGLGLSICRQIVQAHGGRLTADNAPGGGAVFRVRLPLAKPAAAGVAPR